MAFGWAGLSSGLREEAESRWSDCPGKVLSMKLRSCLVVAGSIAAISAMIVGCSSPSSPAQADPQWVAIFDGDSLDGWTPKIAGFALGENFADTFRVEDGLLKVAYDGYQEFGDRFGHLFYDEVLSHYRLRVEYRFVGDQIPGGPGWALRNSGVMLHGQAPETMGKDQWFPVSIEVQFLGGDGSQERPTANLCTPGTHVEKSGELVTRHCTNSSSPTFHGEEWVLVEVEVQGSEVIRHFVNGQEVLFYEKPQFDPTDSDAQSLIRGDSVLLGAGTISLQSESHPVEFRKVELLRLDGP